MNIFRSPLARGILLAFVLIAIIEAAFLGALSSAIFQTEQQAEKEYQLLIIARDLSESVESAGLCWNSLDAVKKDPRNQQKIPLFRFTLKKVYNEFDELGKDFAKVGVDPAAAQKIKQNFVHMEALVDRLIARAKADPTYVVEDDEILPDVIKIFVQMLKDVDAAFILVKEKVFLPFHGTDIMQLMYLAIFVNVTMFAILAYLAERSIARPIRVLSEECARITSGELLNKPARINNEIGSLEQSFYVLSTIIRENEVRRRSNLELLQAIQAAALEKISNCFQKLLKIPGLSDKAARKFSASLNSLASLKQLLDSMTAALREGGSSSVVVHKSRFSSAHLLDAAVASTESLVNKSKIDLQRIESDNYQLEADEQLLVRILINYLSNAIKYSPPGGRIELTVSAESDFIRFSVRDQGPGISRENSAKLFERFIQVAAADGVKRQGTGLGLAICKEIAEKHGGNVGCDSEVGVGSCFWFTLPSSSFATNIAGAGSKAPIAAIGSNGDLTAISGPSLGSSGEAVFSDHSSKTPVAESIDSNEGPTSIAVTSTSVPAAAASASASAGNPPSSSLMSPLAAAPSLAAPSLVSSEGATVLNSPISEAHPAALPALATRGVSNTGFRPIAMIGSLLNRGGLKKTFAVMLAAFIIPQLILAVNFQFKFHDVSRSAKQYNTVKEMLFRIEELYFFFLNWRLDVALTLQSQELSKIPEIFSKYKVVLEKTIWIRKHSSEGSWLHKEILKIMVIEKKILHMLKGVVADKSAMGKMETQTIKSSRKDMSAIDDGFALIMDTESKKLKTQYTQSNKLREEILACLAAAAVLNILVLFAVSAMGLKIIEKIAALQDKSKQFAEGGKIEMTLTGTDELSHLDQRLVEVCTVIREAQAEQQVLMSVINHDLRTPLASILSVLEMTAGGVYVQLSPEYKEMVSDAHREVNRLLTSSDLLTLEKIDAGAFDLQTEETPLIPALEKVLQEQTIDAAAKNITLNMMCEEVSNDQVIQVDRTLFERAISIILENAISAAPESSIVWLRIRKSGNASGNAAKADGAVEILVEDKGKGISDDLLSQIFQRFRQVDGKPLSGLGLPLAFRVSKLHGGNMSITSSSSGSSVSFFSSAAPGAN